MLFETAIVSEVLWSLGRNCGARDLLKWQWIGIAANRPGGAHISIIPEARECRI